MPGYSGPLEQLAATVREMVDVETSSSILEGIEALGKNAKPESVALWCKGAIDRMDRLLDEESKVRIMNSLGHNCAEKNKRPIQAAARRRSRYKSLSDFLEAEVKKPPRGTRIGLDGDRILFYYTPNTYRAGLRCYCSLFHGLPPSETASLTYCNCSKGFVEKYWEAITGGPVAVDLEKSCIAGSTECMFTVHL